MTESECRHLPEPVYNPPRCPKCGALVRRAEPTDARLLAAAKFFASWCPQFSERYGAEHDHHLDAIADAERAKSPAPPPGTEQEREWTWDDWDDRDNRSGRDL